MKRILFWLTIIGQALFDVGMAGGCGMIRRQKDNGEYVYEFYNSKR